MPENIDDIGIIMLAAGYSKRFMGDKREALLENGKSLLDTTLSRVPDCIKHRILVLHPGDEELAASNSANWSICVAEEASRGMGFSLSAGIRQARDWPALIVALGDMPYVQSSTYQAIQYALLKHALVRPYCQGRAGNPVGISKELYPELERLDGDQGARRVLLNYADRIYKMECTDWGIIKDIDTKEALKD